MNYLIHRINLPATKNHTDLVYKYCFDNHLHIHTNNIACENQYWGLLCKFFWWSNKMSLTDALKQNVSGESKNWRRIKTLKWLITSKNSARKTLAFSLRGSGCGGRNNVISPKFKNLFGGGVMVPVTWKIQGSRISLRYLFLDAQINSVVCGGKCQPPLVIEGILACAKASKRGGGVDARWGHSWSGAKYRRCWGQGPLLQLRGMLRGDLGWKATAAKLIDKNAVIAVFRKTRRPNWIVNKPPKNMKNSKGSNSDVLSQNRTGTTYWWNDSYPRIQHTLGYDRRSCACFGHRLHNHRNTRKPQWAPGHSRGQSSPPRRCFKTFKHVKS